MRKSGKESVGNLLFSLGGGKLAAEATAVFYLVTLFTGSVRHFSMIQCAEPIRYLVVGGYPISRLSLTQFDTVHGAWTMQEPVSI